MYDELTAVDIQKMQEEINYRVRELRPQLIEEVQTARAFGDLSENYEYKCAKQAKNRNDSRIRYLERMIRTAKVIEVKETADAVGLFDTVTVYNEMMKREMIVRIVTTLRQDALKGLFWRCWRDTSRRNWRTGGAIWRCPGRHPRGRGRPCGIWRRRRTATPVGSWRPGISSPASPTGPIWCAACSARGVGRRNCGEATMRRRAAA